MTFAHSKNSSGDRHDLVEHLRSVARLAGQFATGLDAEDLAYYAGLWHDLGKFHPDFQTYLLRTEDHPRGRGRGPDHKAAGAALARQHMPLISWLIHGHHGGLSHGPRIDAWLTERLAASAVQEALRLAQSAMPDLLPSQPIDVPEVVRRDPLAAELFIRLVFSALADADFLDTEQHFRADRTTARGAEVPLADLWERFKADQRALLAASRGEVAEIRAEIYQHCLDAASLKPGLFRLTVPTGGGKTRSGMAFALRHALEHGLKRVIVAVPFISITEQTADVYRRIFRLEGAVLEHHSLAESNDDEGGDFHSGAVWDRLAAENWDAPIVVTTTVQLFESIFSNKTSRTRKLHRLARSVIVLDEAQALPPHLLSPILDVLNRLAEQYGSTIVISTATQPAFDMIPAFSTVDRDIVPDPARYFELLRRVSYDWRVDVQASWQEVADWLRVEPTALAVLNTKKDALTLYSALADPAALHLSTLLCGAHRRAVIGEVRRRLSSGEPCRLISTQVIEAGVDLDFPIVFRAMAPLDSVIQAAGRCNREGHLTGQGRVVVFDPEGGGMPPGAYQAGAGQCRSLLRERQLAGFNLDASSPEVIRAYYERFLGVIGKEGLDSTDLQSLRRARNYPEVAKTFRMIDDDTYDAIITSYGSAEERRRVDADIKRLATGGPDSRFVRRRLHPYVVSLRLRESQRLLRDGLLQEIRPGIGVWLGDYDGVLGIAAGDPQAERLVV